MPRRVSLIIIPLFLTACADRSVDPAMLNDSTRSAAASSIVPIVSDDHPVSIPALMKKQYDGRDLKLGSVLAQTSTYTRYYVTYKSGELTISGILNIPKGTGPFPVIITNHGFIEPSVYTNGRGLKREQDYFSSRGYAVLHPDYRNHASSDKDPENDVRLRLGYVEDVINAVYAIKNSTIPQLDKENIVMLGHSMGGGVTISVLVAQPRLVKAAVLYAAVSPDARRNYDRWLKRRPEVAAKIQEAYGSPEDNPEFWDNVSAQSFLGQIQAPVALFHGDRDVSVPVEWSRELFADLQELGKETVYQEYPGESHEFGPHWTDFMKRSEEFFDSHVAEGGESR